MADKHNPDSPPAPAGPGRAPRNPVPTSDPGQREEWAQWVERMGSHFSRLMVREADYLQANPADKQARGAFDYYKHAVGFTQWLAWRIRAGKLRRDGE